MDFYLISLSSAYMLICDTVIVGYLDWNDIWDIFADTDPHICPL